MRKIKNTVFIADDMDLSGIRMLGKNFTVRDLRDLDNANLLKNVISHSHSSGKSALIIRSVRKIDSKFLNLLRKSTSVGLICTISSGYDNIDVKTASKCGIDVLNTPGGNNISAAEFTMGLILSTAKGIIKLDSNMRHGGFNKTGTANYELAGKTIGIIGVGRVGSKVAKFSRSFSMNVLGNDIKKGLAEKYRFIRFLTLEKLLASSDIITIHTPLDKSTLNLLNSRNMRLMKAGAVLINCSRGGTVDEEALIKYLKRGQISYAAVDVFRNEPEFNTKFRMLPNVILSPHQAGKTPESKKRMALITAQNVIKYFTNGRSSVKLVN